MILTDIQSAIRDTVRAFAQEKIRPYSARFEAEEGYPRALFQEMAGLGLWGMTAPETFGGAEADAVSYALALMEIAAADGALSTIVSIQNSILVSGLLKDGSEEQKARFLPDLISGRTIGAFALTEADAGSDASALRTLAVKVDGGWRIHGAKQFITSGKIARVVMIIAVTDPDAGKKGLSAFIVPTDRPGYGVDKVEHRSRLPMPRTVKASERRSSTIRRWASAWPTSPHGWRRRGSSSCMPHGQRIVACRALSKRPWRSCSRPKRPRRSCRARCRRWVAMAIWKNMASPKSIGTCASARSMKVLRTSSAW